MNRNRRFTAVLPGHEREKAHDIEVQPLGSNQYAVIIDGVRHEVDAIALPFGGVSFLDDTSAFVAELEERGDEVQVTFDGRTLRVDIADERRRMLRKASATLHIEGRHEVTSPMPGKIVKVLVKKGEAVTRGQGLVVVEAMKMENELKSPKDGTVQELFAIEGTAVENGARLLVVE